MDEPTYRQKRIRTWYAHGFFYIIPMFVLELYGKRHRQVCIGWLSWGIVFDFSDMQDGDEE